MQPSGIEQIGKHSGDNGIHNGKENEWNAVLLNRTDNVDISARLRHRVLIDAIPFLLFFVAFVIYVLTLDGLTYQPQQHLFVVEAHKYLHNFMALPWVSILFLLGVLLVLAGIIMGIACPKGKYAIWPAGLGTVLTVLGLLLVTGFNNTAYYPSVTNPQSSLCLANSCSSEFTLSVMSVVSLFIPFVLAYIIYAWWAIERK